MTPGRAAGGVLHGLPAGVGATGELVPERGEDLDLDQVLGSPGRPFHAPRHPSSTPATGAPGLK